MAFDFKIPVRFSDVDYARVVYYPRFFDYCHHAFEAFFPAEVGISYAELLERRNVGFPTVHAEGDFRAPLRFGEICRVRLETLKQTSRSLTCRYRFFVGAEAEPRAECNIVTAAIDMHAFRAVEIPEDVRQAFSRHGAPETP
ncbi:MAG: acyl-CoA thioesterase [Myxococcaceae bacterium]